MSSSRRYALLLAAALVLIAAAVVAVMINRRGGFPSRAAASRPAAARAQKRIAPVVKSARPDAASDIERSLDGAVAETSSQSASADDVHQAMNSREAYWKQEDAVMSKMPAYESERDAMLKKARDLIEAAGADNAQKIIALANEELDKFWDAGSLSSPDSYDHGYLARAILEVGLERNQDDFTLLSRMREVLNSTAPLRLADWTPNMTAIDALWAVAQRQKGLIDSGKVTPSVDAMLAMADWVQLATYERRSSSDIAAALDWLVDNADAGGWSPAKRIFQTVSKPVKAGVPGAGLGFNLRSLAVPSTSRSMNAENGRRLPSLEGSREYRKKAIALWDAQAISRPGLTVTYSGGTISGPSTK